MKKKDTQYKWVRKNRKKSSIWKRKKSLVGWKKMPNTNEEGTNRKKKSNMEGINWKKTCIIEIKKGQIGKKSPILKRNGDIRKK